MLNGFLENFKNGSFESSDLIGNTAGIVDLEDVMAVLEEFK